MTPGVCRGCGDPVLLVDQPDGTRIALDEFPPPDKVLDMVVVGGMAKPADPSEATHLRHVVVCPMFQRWRDRAATAERFRLMPKKVKPPKAEADELKARRRLDRFTDGLT